MGPRSISFDSIVILVSHIQFDFNLGSLSSKEERPACSLQQASVDASSCDEWKPRIQAAVFKGPQLSALQTSGL